MRDDDWWQQLFTPGQPARLTMSEAGEPVLFTRDATGALSRRPVRARRRFSGEFMQLSSEEEISRVIGQASDDMIYEISTQVLTENLPPEEIVQTGSVSIEVPANWWQLLKHRIGWKWVLRWWPTKRVTLRVPCTLKVDLRRFRVYPDAINMPGLGAPVAHHEMTARWKDTE
jgi:hypothetical protein